jgi:hypothetical protein
MEPCIVIVNQAQLGKVQNYKQYEELFEGLNSLCPEVVVMIGDFQAEENVDTTDPFEKLR